jgi:hypothetical protein
MIDALARSAEIPVADIGYFPSSSEFTHASSKLIYEIRGIVPILSAGLSLNSPSLGERARYYAEREGRASLIVADFLHKVLGDLTMLLGDKELALGTPSEILQLTFTSHVEATGNHIDPLLDTTEVQLRHLTANAFPATIDGLPNFQVGSVARIRRDVHLHSRP